MSVGEHLEVSESDGAVKIKGTYNPMTFWVEGAYTLYESLSDEERQEMCESSLIVTPPKGIPTSSPTPTPTRAPDCTGFTRDDFLHANEAVIASYARGAYPMEIWINPSDDTVQRLSYWDTQEQANWPGLEPLSLGSLEDLRYVVIEFSGYGEITVEIPELDLD